MHKTHDDQLLALAKQKGVLRARDVVQQGIPHSVLSRLTQQGRLQRVERGLYMLPASPVTEYHSLVEACMRVPTGVICLLSALSFHHLTTQMPFQIWMALENKAWQPQIEILPLRFFRFSGSAFIEGVDVHILEGTPVKIYNPAKTVADCFKYRNKIGLDLCLEALRTGLQLRKFSVAQLRHYAELCRILTVITPYTEAII